MSITVALVLLATVVVVVGLAHGPNRSQPRR
jgi:hypothetical protein